MPANAVRRFFAEHNIEPCGVVAAVSGGADSSALLLALADLVGFTIHCAHVNHHLRGADSDADEAFVRELCARLGIPFHLADGALDDDVVRRRGIEGAARDVRYALLGEIRDAVGARFVATAHQKNDQAETVLMRLLTGSGMAGLRGIHPMRDDGFIRPLLEVTRDEIDSFLRERGVVPRHDLSNEDPRFLRNRVRVVVRDLRAVDALAAMARQARALWPVLERAIDDFERVSAEVQPHETRFLCWPDDRWLRQALLHRHIHRLDPAAAREVSTKDLERLASGLDAVKRVSVTKNLELIRRNDVLVLRHLPRPTPEFEITLTSDQPAFIPELSTTLHIARLHEPRATNDEQRIQLPENATAQFTVRNRRTGDRFHPLGLPFSKKLKDFLIDRKIAAELRDHIPLLVWNGEIIWVAGVEVSERFRVTGSAGDVYAVWLEGV